MTGFNGPPRRFRVDMLPAIPIEAERLYREAEETGRGAAFAVAVKRIIAILRSSPREFGEPLWTYHHAHMEVRVGIVTPASVRFAVHASANEVVILAVNLLEAG